MLSYGINIQSNSEPLQKVPIEYIHDMIRNPKAEMISLLRTLSTIRELDIRQYNSLKRRLPYFVCGIFNPPFRKIENFAYTEYFVIDLDHISANNTCIDSIRETIIKDNNVLLCFQSPSQDGLKIVFRLSEKCYDAGLYSVFYRTYSRHFSTKYNLEGILDNRTSDVSRACFLSSDPNIYFNPKAESIHINSWIETNNVAELLDLKREMDKEKKAQEEASVHMKMDPDKETMDRIRSILNSKKGTVVAKNEVFVPPEIEMILDGLVSRCTDEGLIVNTTTGIQYGKNIKFQLGQKKAEINLFYGKKGFTVVQCPRTGTSSELNQLVADLVRDYLNDVN